MDASQLETLLSPDYISKEIIEVHRWIYQVIENTPAPFGTYWLNKGKSHKPLAVVDLQAEQLFMLRVTKRFGKNSVKIIGEETPDSELDLRHEKRICVLIDMIDGTDLFERGLSNWCSAVVVFDPSGPEILGAFVAVPPIPPSRSGFLYYATSAGAFKTALSENAKDPSRIPLANLDADRRLADATFCLNGQKSSALLRLLALGKHEKLMAWLTTNVERDKLLKISAEGAVGFRFYDLAGNPMMARLAEDTVHLIIDLKGQAPHDMIPGTFIALKAGAHIRDHNGAELTLNVLAKKLLQPGDETSKIKYILASNESILNEMLGLLS